LAYCFACPILLPRILLVLLLFFSVIGIVVVLLVVIHFQDTILLIVLNLSLCIGVLLLCCTELSFRTPLS
jgi:hypothetical protein